MEPERGAAHAAQLRPSSMADERSIVSSRSGVSVLYVTYISTALLDEDMHRWNAS